MENVKSIVRIAGADIHGNKSIYEGLRRIKGVSFMFSNAVCNYFNMDKDKKIGTLNEEEVKKIEDLIKHPESKLPVWLLNRRKDYDTGKDLHLIEAQLNLSKEFDIKRMKKIKSYKGMRHALGQPVRGQRTRSHFRSGRSVGVQKKSVSQKPAKDKKE